MKKPLVVHIITRLEPGGSSRNVIDSCAAQIRDYDVVLISGPHKDSGALLKLLPPEVICLEVRGLQRELRAAKDLRALLELKKEIARLGPDIVHTHTSKAGALGRLAAALANLGAKKPAVVIHTPHGHLLYGYYGALKTFILKLAERFLANFTDHFIALTPGEMKESAAAGIGRAEQWTVVHSGVDFRPPVAPARKADLDIAEDEIAVGTIARLEPVKGVEYLIRAAELLDRRLPAARLKYVIIGGGELEAELRKLAGRLGVGGRIIFTGFRQDAAALLPALDIYAQPSLNEAMGRAPLEAQALGLPVVVSRVCGLPDIIREGETGLAVKAGDADELAFALERLILSPKLRARMGPAAKAWAAAPDGTGFPRFGVESMNAKLLALYARVLGDAAPAARE